jgi:hypothetical protein
MTRKQQDEELSEVVATRISKQTLAALDDLCRKESRTRSNMLGLLLKHAATALAAVQRKG